MLCVNLGCKSSTSTVPPAMVATIDYFPSRGVRAQPISPFNNATPKMKHKVIWRRRVWHQQGILHPSPTTNIFKGLSCHHNRQRCLSTPTRATTRMLSPARNDKSTPFFPTQTKVPTSDYPPRVKTWYSFSSRRSPWPKRDSGTLWMRLSLVYDSSNVFYDRCAKNNSCSDSGMRSTNLKKGMTDKHLNQLKVD